ncbi:MAG TPA: winged helix-turn-helix domain-containing protein [bacterium]
MIETLFGSINREKVLLFLYFRSQGYAREISRFYNTDLNQIQKQLERLAAGGVLNQKTIGKIRLYSLNPSYTFSPELNAILDRLSTFYPEFSQGGLFNEEEKPAGEIKRYETYDPDLMD